jgi:novobiocin biosynthesis protein NovU/D-mycarose 3-C-methyltransferase
VDFFEKTEFDTVYHEHLSYVSVRSVEALLAKSPFRLHRVDHYPIHGGSVLLQIRRRSDPAPAHESVARFIGRERHLDLDEATAWQPFVKRVQHIQTQLPALLRQIRARDQRVIGYGASAKGNTLLNTCGLTASNLDYIIDNTPFKQGKVAPGSWIPVKPPEALLKDRPDYALLLAWNFADEIIARETEYQRGGGRFIIPIPEPRVVEFPR